MNSKERKARQDAVLHKIGLKLKKLRIAKGVSYTALAEELGISRNTYNLIELGKTNFQFRTLIAILEYHNLSFEDFFQNFQTKL
jgi:DNA-binding XRE family transcriptional regulator